MEKSEVRKLLRQLGYRSTHIGYEYMVELIVLMSKETDENKRIQAAYYREIADTYNTNENAVGKAIRYLVSKNYTMYENSLINKVLGAEIEENMSVKQILNLLCCYVVEKEYQ